jgi:hypothetical protein
MSDRALLVELLDFLESRTYAQTTEEKIEEIRTRMAAFKIDNRFEHCIYAISKCELDLVDQDGDPYCTVCLKCPKYRTIKDEEKKDEN